MRLLIPVWYIPFYEPQPYLARLALDLCAVLFQLLQLIGILDVAENRFEKGKRDVANIVEEVDVLDQALPGQFEETRDRHRRGGSLRLVVRAIDLRSVGGLGCKAVQL
jgi:hypothetical protein